MTRSDRRAALTLATLLALVVWGLYRASVLAWICDDAFISLRYAENLVAGNGLVYNVGERVEGYSNLLWTLLLAGLTRAGVDPVRAAEGAGILAYAALALALALASWQRSRETGRPYLPLAAGLVLVSADFHEWATGGLETMLFAALGVPALVLTQRVGALRSAPWLAGLLFALLVLTRLDGVLLAAAGALSYWLPPDRFTRRTQIRHCLATLAPVVATLAVLFTWKLVYYGDLFPTAFYSKSALRPYYDQGLIYVALYLVKNWFLLAVGALAIGERIVRGRRGPAGGRIVRGRRGPADARWDDRFLLITCLLYVAYVVHHGGDFMFARRLVLVAPLAFLVIESLISRWPAERWRMPLAAAVLVAAALPIPLLAGQERIYGIGDERAVYPAEKLAVREHQAREVGNALAGTPARVAFEGGMCAFGYYSGLPYLVELTGLTQYSLAKLPLAERGYIGHEKTADDAWLTENEIHFVVSQKLPPLSRPAGVLRVDEIYFGDLARARIHLYSDAVMDPLRGDPNVDFVPIERVIELSIRRMEGARPAEAEEIWRGFGTYYLRAAGATGEAKARALRALYARTRSDG